MPMVSSMHCQYRPLIRQAAGLIPPGGVPATSSSAVASNVILEPTQQQVEMQVNTVKPGPKPPTSK